MASYKIISDSSCDLSEEYCAQNDIGKVPFYISFDQEKYLKEGAELKNDDFYKKLRDEHAIPKTSLPSVQDYIDIFKPSLKEGMDVVCICISSKFSGSSVSALNAKSVLLEVYKDRKIEIIDSCQATAGQGLLVIEAIKMRDAGVDFDTLVKTMYKMIEGTRLVFTVDSLEYLEKGGRVGKASALASSILNIKPIIILNDGELLPVAKCHGRKKSISEISKYINKYIELDINKYNFSSLNSECVNEALELQKVVTEKYGIKFDIPPFNVGVTIGSHTGMGAVGIAFVPKYTNFIN